MEYVLNIIKEIVDCVRTEGHMFPKKDAIGVQLKIEIIISKSQCHYIAMVTALSNTTQLNIPSCNTCVFFTTSYDWWFIFVSSYSPVLIPFAMPQHLLQLLTELVHIGYFLTQRLHAKLCLFVCEENNLYFRITQNKIRTHGSLMSV